MPGRTLCAAALFLALLATLHPQTTASTPRPAGAAQAGPLDALTPDQKTRFQAATARFGGGDYAGALPALRQLLKELPPGSPAQIVVAKYATESALNTGDREFAFSLLKPILAAAPNDWQAESLLVRAYTESGQKVERDAALAHLMSLHKQGMYPQLNQMNQFQMERVPYKDGVIRIWYSFVPWSAYKTYMFARVFDKSGQQVLRVTLESSDLEQPKFAGEHPDLAAKGERFFSLDAYGNETKADNGDVIETHSTYEFFNGQPSYDAVRERMIAIANRQATPMSRSTYKLQQK